MPQDPTPASTLHLQFTALLAEVSLALRTAFGSRIRVDQGGRAAARVLNLDKTLGWRVFVTAFSADDARVVKAFPGKLAWRKVIVAIETLGVSTPRIASLRRAVAALESFVETHQLPRQGLDAWSRRVSTSPEGDQQALRLRKSATNANRSLLGVHLRANIAAYLVAPSSTPGFAALAGAKIVDGPSREPSASPFPIYRPLLTWSDEGVNRSAGDAHPAASPRWPSLVSELSSEAITNDELCLSGAKGERAFDFLGSASTRPERMYFSFAELIACAGPVFQEQHQTEKDHSQEDQTDDEMQFALLSQYPTDLLVFDVLMHRDLPFDGPPDSGFYHGGLPRPGEESISRAFPVHCGAALTRPQTPQLPAPSADRCATYEALLVHCAEALGTALADYRIYRLCLEHPPIRLSCVMSWHLPRAR